jgi:hypothetical protein
MRSASRALLALLATLALAAALAACGSGGGGTTSTSTAATGSTAPGTAKAPPSHGPANAPAGGAAPSHAAPLIRASARAAARRAGARQAARHRALARKAGRAAPFLVPAGDNSIPTYGSESSDSQRGSAEAALRAYLEARAAGDWSGACAQMAATVQKQLALLGGEKGKGCAAAYAKLASRIPAKARANPLTGSLAAFRVESPHGFALFYGPKRQQYMMPMVSEAGAWKVNQLEPIPWPIGAPANAP